MYLLTQWYWRQKMMMSIMMVMPAAVGAGFRLERREFFSDRCPQTCQHVFQYKVFTNTKKAFTDLCLCMAITQMEGAAQQNVRICTVDAIGWLGRSNDAHNAAIIAEQQIAIAQHRTANGEHRNFFAGGKGGAKAAFFALVIGENQFAGDVVGLFYFGMYGKHCLILGLIGQVFWPAPDRRYKYK